MLLGNFSVVSRYHILCFYARILELFSRGQTSIFVKAGWYLKPGAANIIPNIIYDIRSNKHKHTLAKQSWNLARNNYISLTLLRSDHIAKHTKLEVI